MLLAPIVCSLLAAGPEAHGAVLYVRSEQGFRPVAGLRQDLWVVLPLVSRSPLVERISTPAEGCGLRIAAGSERGLELRLVELSWIRHGAAELLVAPQPPEREPWIASDARLPRSATRVADGADVLPWVARQDGSSAAGPLQLEYDDALDLARVLLVGTACSGAQVAAGGIQVQTRDGERFPLAEAWFPAKGLSGAILSVAPEAPGIDQILLVTPRALGAQDRQALPIRSASLGRARCLGHTLVDASGLRWPRLEVESREPHAGALKELALIPDAILDIDFELPQLSGAAGSLLVHLVVGSQDTSEPLAAAPAAAGLFRDVAREVGIDMLHFEGPDEQLDIRPTMGPGAAWGDVDGDGWVDLFLPQGAGRAGSRAPTSRLFRNLGNGQFEDVSRSANLALVGAGMGALFFDADGDGDLDLFVASYGKDRFLLNDGQGHFADATAAWGVPQDERWHAAVSAADFDQDGDLDLYVTSYLHYDPALMPPAEELGRYQREDPLEMLPFAFPGERNTFLRNETRVKGAVNASAPRAAGAQLVGPRFSDVTDELKLGDASGRGMQAVFWDFDRDGDQDLYVANDVSPNTFWRNEGDGRFKDISISTGLDDPRGCMGLCAGDVDGDGDEDLFVTNWQLESNALYVNNLVANTSVKHRVSTFRDQSVQAGLAQLSVGVTGWGCELADFDLDGDLDLFYANGYTSPDYESTGICVGQPCHYFENDGRGKFTPAFERAGPDAAQPLAGRCVLACDYDQDGDLDLVVTANNGRVRLLRNETPRGPAWLGLRLRGQGSNRFAIGAEVTLRCGGKLQRRALRAGTSYLGGNAPELSFGLGDAKAIDELVVRWPDGRESRHTIEHLNTFVTLEQPR